MMSILFEPMVIKRMELKNRFVRSATYDGYADHRGRVTDKQIQFLSPYLNRRNDQWGGHLENRLRLHREILKDIRAKTGEDYPLLIKIGVQDGFPGGLEFREGALAARFLAEWGFDALEISSGLRGKRYEGTEFKTKLNRPEREAYFRGWCKEILYLDRPL